MRCALTIGRPVQPRASFALCASSRSSRMPMTRLPPLPVYCKSRLGPEYTVRCFTDAGRDGFCQVDEDSALSSAPLGLVDVRVRVLNPSSRRGPDQPRSIPACKGRFRTHHRDSEQHVGGRIGHQERCCKLLFPSSIISRPVCNVPQWSGPVV